MRSAVKRARASARQSARSISPRRPTARTAAPTSCDQEAGAARNDQLGHRAARVGDDRRPGGQRFDDSEPERLVEVDEMQQGERAPQQPVALRWADRSEERDGVAVDVRFDVATVVLGVVHDTGDDQGKPDGARHLDRLTGALVRVDPSEEQEVAAVTPTDGERLDVDPVVDRRGVRQVRVPVGVADRHVVRDVVVGAVDGEDAVGREPVDRRDHGSRREPTEDQRQEVELVADDVELVRALEHRGDVQRLEDLGVDRRVLLVPRGRHGVQTRGGLESAVANRVTS